MSASPPPPPERPLHERILLDRRYGLVRTGIAVLALPLVGILVIALFLALMIFGQALF